MTNYFFINRIRVLAFSLFLWMSTVCICILYSPPPVSATELQSGESGSCTWKYEQINDDIVLTIAPTDGNVGTLDSFFFNRSEYRENTKRVVVERTVKVAPSTRAMFQDFQQAESIDCRGLDVTNVSNMCCMFSNCPALASVDTRGWDTSSVTNMSEMFQNCSALTSVFGVENWKTHNVTDMSAMFRDCHAFSSLNLEGWNMRAVTDKAGMFSGLHFLKNITLGENAQIAGANFEEAGSYVGSDWARVEREAPENLSRDFVDPVQDDKRAGCSMRYVRQMVTRGLSGDCMWEYISQKDARGNVVEDAAGEEIYKLCICPLPGRESGMLDDWSDLPAILPPVSPWSQPLSERYRLQTTRIEIEKVNGVRPVKAQTCAVMFKDFKKAQTIDISGLGTSGVKDMCNMFEGCHSLSSLDLKELVVSQVTTMEQMFDSCKKLQSLDLKDWDVSNVTHMQYLFADCHELISLNLEGWRPSALTTVYGAFENCHALTSLNLSGWSTAKVTPGSMGNMFYGTHSLKDIILDNNFQIENGTRLGEDEFHTGMCWMRVAGGTAEDPQGEVVASAEDLAAFHNDNNRAKRQSNDERYVCVISKLVINFDKGADDARGIMEPQSFNYDEEKALTANGYRRAGYDFDGWKDDKGNFYIDKQLLKNAELALNAQRVLTARWKRKARTISLDANASKGTKIGAEVPELVSVERGIQPQISEHVAGNRVPHAQHEDATASARGAEELAGGDTFDNHQSGWNRENDKVFYYKNHEKSTGWQKLSGTIQNPASSEKNWFYFGENGVMFTGRYKLVGGLKNTQGVQELNWFYFDEATGAQVRGWHRIVEDGAERWYYYRPEDGVGLVGRHQIVGGFESAQGVQELNWFYFDEATGAQVRGWHRIVEDGAERWYYYRPEDGVGLVGRHQIVGGFESAQGVQELNWFFFDEATGAQVRGWHRIVEDGVERWYYYRDGDGIMLKGQHELVGGFGRCKNWFYFDEVTGVQIRGWKDIPSQSKTCYYGGDGAMYKGRHVIDHTLYDFDSVTGARQ